MGTELELDIATTEDTRENDSLKSTEKADTTTDIATDITTLSTKLESVDRQYTPSGTLQLDNDLESSNESNFQSLVGSWKLTQEPGLPRSHAAVDLLVTIFCFVTVHFAYLGHLDFSSQRTIAMYLAVVFIILSLTAGGVYDVKRLRSLNSELKNLLLCWMCGFAAVVLFAFLSKTAVDISRVWLSSSMLVSLAALAGVRALGCFGFLAGAKVGARNVVVCGNAPSIKSVMQSLEQLSNPRVRVAKIFEFSTQRSQAAQPTNSVQSSAEQINEFIENQRQSGVAIEQVWIAVSQDQSQVVEQLSETLLDSTVDVCVVPDLYTERLIKGDLIRFGETEVVNISNVSLSPAADQFKRVFDIVLASIAALILCIPMAIIAGLIKIESPGPALFRQKRYGVDGQEIEVLKFRSMRVHSDKQVRQATKNDARVTRLGKILRRTSLDELPQLLNVLRGTMSLVGPRPHATAHNELWRNQINGYMLRHKVRPGITGWAQVNGWRGETDTVFKMQQRVKFDLAYIQNWSPWLDVKIIFRTVIKLRDENAY